MPKSVNELLQHLGLDKYVAVFDEHEIDLAAAQHLTEDDLKELGLPMGPRRKFTAAMGEIATISLLPPGAGADQTTIHTPGQHAERRPLTVMFCDLVDSTSLSRELDPEDLRDLMLKYQDTVAGVVTRYGGHVAKYLGDGVLAYFGWPQAYEDQAERAVRAALETVESVSRYKREDDQSISVRIGIASGQVVVGDLVGDVATEADAVVGETPNLAARLQSIAEPGQIIIGAATHRLLRAAFKFDDLGPRVLKGFDEPVPTWSVLGEGSADSRFDASRSGQIGEIFGRGHELGLLSERWQRAIAGEGQVVVLTGDAGFGKSRLIRALSDDIAVTNHYRLSYQCSPHHTNSALFPIVQRLNRAAGFTDKDSPDEKLDKIEVLLKRAEADISSIAPIFATLLAVPHEQRYGILDLEPQQLRTRTIDALVGQVLALSRQRPVLMIVEDVHWMDPTTEALVSELIGTIEDAAVLVAVTQRPEYHPPWQGYAHLTTIVLNRLDRSQAARIIQAVAGDELPSEILRNILDRSAGVPLFLEELTKSLIESDALEEPIESITIPDSLQASLLSRLDRLGEAKEMAQIGAVIGREFPHNLIESLSDQPQHTLRLMDSLVRSELVFQRGEPPDASYTFKHALIQDTAYDSLLHSRRKQLHGQVLAELERTSGQGSDDDIETLAYHAGKGELWEKSLHYSRLAGLRANERSAYREAISFMDAGLAAAEHLGDERHVLEQVIEIYMNMRPSLGSFGKYDRLLSVLSEANRLAQIIGDDANANFADVIRTHVLYQTGHVEDVLQFGERTVRLARLCPDERIVVAATANLAMGYCFHGDFRRAIEVASEFEDELKTNYRHENLGTTGTSSVNWLSNLSGMYTNLGEFEEAMARSETARQIAEETGKPFDAAMFAQWRAHLFGTMGKPQEAIDILETSEEALREYNIDFLRTWMDSWRGAAFALQGDLSNAEDALLTAAGLAEKSGLRLSGIWTLTRLSNLFLEKGDIATGAEYAASAHSQAVETGARWFQLPALQCMARAMSLTGDSETARQFWHRAIELAELLQARPDLAHSRYGLGTHFQNTNQFTEAVDELQRAENLYRSLGMTFWLPRTEERLSEVSSRA